MSEVTNQNLAVVNSNPEAVISQLKALKKAKTGLNINREYFNFDETKKTRGVFLGFGEFEKVSEETGEIMGILVTVVWIDEDMNIYENAGTGLVGACKQLKQNTPIEIELTGRKKVKKGSMNVFAVRPLITEAA